MYMRYNAPSPPKKENHPMGGFLFLPSKDLNTSAGDRKGIERERSQCEKKRVRDGRRKGVSRPAGNETTISTSGSKALQISPSSSQKNTILIQNSCGFCFIVV